MPPELSSKLPAGSFDPADEKQDTAGQVLQCLSYPGEVMAQKREGRF
ncbi:hypothetical protein SAMN02745219_01582 [Desulfofundulus thermosubterraneus DSM 16057]|uniref:Uncharacterized protein n=1 Tax=Desulfofundulus thermosubterraneus DSM 16057 TaxID=1121432 RepID=A0A1M6FX78_9FIRM|nr:hypothetical protein SAMN02745219_01582 [Desulfofundulus thermosubterraneus DSM 16057]